MECSDLIDISKGTNVIKGVDLRGDRWNWCQKGLGWGGNTRWIVEIKQNQHEGSQNEKELRLESHLFCKKQWNNFYIGCQTQRALKEMRDTV